MGFQTWDRPVRIDKAASFASAEETAAPAASFARSETEEGTVGEWQTIESAPKDGTEVDLWMVDRIAGLQWREPDAFYQDGWWVTLDVDAGVELVGHPGIQVPTHWMKPPAPPSTALGNPPVAR